MATQTHKKSTTKTSAPRKGGSKRGGVVATKTTKKAGKNAAKRTQTQQAFGERMDSALVKQVKAAVQRSETDAEAADMLNKKRVKTVTGKPFTARRVRWIDITHDKAGRPIA